MTSNSGNANSHSEPYKLTISVPETPGPPKLTNKGPKELLVDAAIRIKEISINSPPGFS